MHIPDGILPGEVCAAGFAGSASLTWLCVRMARRKYPDPSRMVSRASVMSAAFFVASWIHIPLPPLSVHPVMAGLMGVVLGWLSFPAVLVALFFQAAMFGHGGFTSLGVNSLLMGGSALAAGALFRMVAGGKTGRAVPAAGFISGFSGVVLAAASTAAVLLLTLPAYIDPVTERAAVTAMALAHLPLAFAEGVFTGMTAGLLARMSPEMLA